jgi:hypothetical protein
VLLLFFFDLESKKLLLFSPFSGCKELVKMLLPSVLYCAIFLGGLVAADGNRTATLFLPGIPQQDLVASIVGSVCATLFSSLFPPMFHLTSKHGNFDFQDPYWQLSLV